MNDVLEAARRIVAWDDSGRLADDEWLVERNESAIIAIARALLSTSAAVRGMREALSELLAADDAMAAFIIAAEPSVLGEAEWAQQHRERSARRRRAIAKARAALSGIEPGEDEQARGQGRSAPISNCKEGYDQ